MKMSSDWPVNRPRRSSSRIEGDFQILAGVPVKRCGKLPHLASRVASRINSREASIAMWLRP